jgi:hypothetical protein
VKDLVHEVQGLQDVQEQFHAADSDQLKKKESEKVSLIQERTKQLFVSYYLTRHSIDDITDARSTR